MSSLTFNSIVDILEAEFLLGRAAIRPEATLAELGLDPPARRDFVQAVEDAFRLSIPHSCLDPQGHGLALRGLCELLEALQHEPLPARNLVAREVKQEFAFP